MINDIRHLEFPVGIVHTLMKVAALNGISLDVVFERTAIDINSLVTKETVSVAVFEQLIECLIELSPQKNFHILFAQAFTFSHIEALETLIVSGSTGEETIREVFLYKELFMPLFDVVVDRRADDVIKYASNTWHPVSEKYYYAEMVFVVILEFGYRLLNYNYMVEKISFRHAKTRYHELMQQLFKCPITYGALEDVAWIKPGVLDSHFVSEQALLHQSVREVLDQQLASLHKTDGLLGKVETLVKQHIGSSEFNICFVAKALAFSPRKLQRELKRRGVSFSGIKTDVRLKEAKTALANDQNSMADIAESLGFSDITSFSRFFREHEGCTPTDYRKLK